MRNLRLPALIVMFLMLSASSYATPDSLLQVLRSEINKKHLYDRQKEQQIIRLKKNLTGNLNLNNKYNAVVALFEIYKDYRLDATFQYAKQLVELSGQLQDPRKLAENRLRLGTTLITSGMFKETFDCLRETDTSLLDNTLKKSYYILYSWAYSDLAKYNSDRFYAPADLDKKFAYLDSAIALTTPGTFERMILEAQRKPGTGKHPMQYYLALMHWHLPPHEEAMVVTGLSRYRSGDEKVQLLATAAINDVRTSTYRAQAMLDLGNTLYMQGKIDDAYFFLQQAMEQAIKFGSQMQRYQVSRILPLVAAHRDIIAQKKQQSFYIYLACVVIIALLTALICFIIFVQLKKARAAERIISGNNRALAEKNLRLWEEGRIKEEYIGFFFSELSRYILKLDKLKNNVQRKLKSGSTEDVLRMLNNVNIHLERNELFHTFDSVFLKLFPDFVEAVNAMLPERDRLKPKASGTLTTNLRIFALMRLGIGNNEMIANILENSVSTVYTYRFRARSRALVPADEFEQRIMGIQLAAGKATHT